MSPVEIKKYPMSCRGFLLMWISSMSHAEFKKHPFHGVKVQGLGSGYNSAVSHLVAIKSQINIHLYK